MIKHNRWICPDCERLFKHPNQWHSCYKGIIDDHFQNKPIEIRHLFDELVDKLSDTLAFSITPLKSTIYLTAISHFAAIHVRQKYIIIEFSNDSPIMNERVYRSQPYTMKLFTHFMRIRNDDEIDNQFIAWITEAYEMTGK